MQSITVGGGRVLGSAKGLKIETQVDARGDFAVYLVYCNRMTQA